MKTRNDAPGRDRPGMFEDDDVKDITDFFRECAEEDACSQYVVLRHTASLPALAEYLHERNEFAQ